MKNTGTMKASILDWLVCPATGGVPLSAIAIAATSFVQEPSRKPATDADEKKNRS